MKKAAVTTMMVALLCATCTIRVEATEITPINPADFELPQMEEQQPIIIQMFHTDLTGCVPEGEDTEIVTPYYLVTREGETIESIARRLEITGEYLLSENSDYRTPEKPFVPWVYVALPEVDWSEVADGVFYIVSSGDCLWNIADYFETNVHDVCTLNPQIENPDVIYVGDFIRVK